MFYNKELLNLYVKQRVNIVIGKRGSNRISNLYTQSGLMLDCIYQLINDGRQVDTNEERWFNNQMVHLLNIREELRQYITIKENKQ